MMLHNKELLKSYLTTEIRVLLYFLTKLFNPHQYSLDFTKSIRPFRSFNYTQKGLTIHSTLLSNPNKNTIQITAENSSCSTRKL